MDSASPPSWLRVYPSRIPWRLDIEFKPIHETILARASETPDKCALIDLEDGACYTYSSLREMALSVASWLQDQGAGPGSMVGFAARNTGRAGMALLGALASGARVVLVDPLTRGEDLVMQVEGRRFKAFIVDSEFYAENKSILEAHDTGRMLVVDGAPSGASSLDDLLDVGDNWSPPALAGDSDSIALYYAGIAGRTMQAIHSHRGLQLAVEAYNVMAGIIRDTVSLAVAPITHVLGLHLSFLSPLAAGGTVVMVRRWDPDAAVRSILDDSPYSVNYAAGAPLMYEQLLERLKAANARGALRLAVSAGAPLKPEVQLGYLEGLGIPLVQAYGMTETLLLTMQPVELASVTGTLGVPLPMVEVMLRDPETGLLKEPPGLGELVVRAPWVMKGYEFPEEDRNAFLDGGWLRTGDLVEVDDRGLFYFRGVLKRIIKYKGYAILPRDLEVVIERHPAVARAVVEGEPDPVVGQKPVARVWIRREWQDRVTPGELMDYVNSRVAFYKKLRDIEIAGIVD